MKFVKPPPSPDDGNGWANTLAPRAPSPPLRDDLSADWLVIGAGFAGLAAARRLAETRPGDEIAIIDAGAVGEGASGRNSGFVIDLPHNVGGDDDQDGAHRALRLARAATETLDEIVRTRQIDCQWSRQGQYMAAASPEGAAATEAFAAGLDALGEPYALREADELPGLIGTTYYRRIVHTPGTVLMQPVALVRGLAATLPENATLYENTPATAVDFDGPLTVETPAGTIRAGGVILAVNGFAPAFGALRNRIFTLGLFCSMTRPLDDEEHAALGCDPDWGLVPVMPFGGPTIRYTQDRRLTMRSQFRWRPSQAARLADFEAAKALQAAQIKARYPGLPGDMIEHTWSGFIAMSKNFAPGFGQHRPGVWTAVCQNGVGVTKGTISGVLAADMATGRDNPLIADMEALGAPSRLPPRPFLDLGVATMMRKLAREQRFEA